MKKIGLWLIAVCMIVCSSFAVISCSDNGGGNTSSSISVTQNHIELNQSTLSMEVYAQYTLTATTNVEEEIVWSTSNAVRYCWCIMLESMK